MGPWGPCMVSTMFLRTCSVVSSSRWCPKQPPMWALSCISFGLTCYVIVMIWWHQQAFSIIVLLRHTNYFNRIDLPAVKPQPPTNVKAVSLARGVLSVTWECPLLPVEGLQCQFQYHSPSAVRAQPEWKVWLSARKMFFLNNFILKWFHFLTFSFRTSDVLILVVVFS